MDPRDFELVSQSEVDHVRKADTSGSLSTERGAEGSAVAPNLSPKRQKIGTSEETLISVSKPGTEPAHLESRLRLLIIGKTGRGKSTIGNNILGHTHFPVACGMTPKTTRVSAEHSDAFQVVDTPDFQELPEGDREREISRLKELLVEPPHGILLATRCDEFTQKEFENYCTTAALLGDWFPPQRLVIVFTFGERDTNIEEMVRANPVLQKVTEAAGGRHAIFSERASDDQRQQLIDIVKRLGSQELEPTSEPAPSARHGGAAIQEHGYSQEPGCGQKHEYRLLIIGKTGTGKSTVGNILLGEPHFSVGAGMESVTTTTQEGSAQLQTDTLKVIETPDFSEMTEESTKTELHHLKHLLPVPPDAALLTVRCDVRYTPEECQIYRQTRELLGDLIPKNRLMIGFTFADRLDGEIEQQLKDVCVELKKVLHDADHRYVLFSEFHSETEKRKQRDLLLDMLRNLYSSEAGGVTIERLWNDAKQTAKDVTKKVSGRLSRKQ